MKIFKTKHRLQKEILNIKNMSFIPTMGGLHKGHVSLIKKSKNFKGPCLVSIYINPKQFNRKKDFIHYPRNIKNDLKILRSLKVNYVYLPGYEDVFNFKTKNKIFLDKFSNKLCGKFRKGHFKGVINIVNRLLEIIKPKYIFLGIKDYQQLCLIKKYIEKRLLKVKVIACKTIREKNGVACSTRNDNIKKSNLIIASKVYWYLINKKKLIKKNLLNFNFLKFKRDLLKLGLKKIDYIELYNSKTLKKTKRKNEKFKIFIAYYLNEVRLIDNI